MFFKGRKIQPSTIRSLLCSCCTRGMAQTRSCYSTVFPQYSAATLPALYICSEDFWLLADPEKSFHHILLSATAWTAENEQTDTTWWSNNRRDWCRSNTPSHPTEFQEPLRTHAIWGKKKCKYFMSFPSSMEYVGTGTQMQSLRSLTSLKMTCLHNSLVEWIATKQGTPTGYGHPGVKSSLLLLHVQTTRWVSVEANMISQLAPVTTGLGNFRRLGDQKVNHSHGPFILS